MGAEKVRTGDLILLAGVLPAVWPDILSLNMPLDDPSAVPPCLHRPILELYYSIHDPSRLQLVDELLARHSFVSLADCKLQDKYGGRSPLELWESQVVRGKVRFDFPEDGVPVPNGTIALRAGQTVCVISKGQTTAGWCSGYVEGVHAPSIGMFPKYFISVQDKSKPSPVSS